MSDHTPPLDDQTPEVVVTPAALPWWTRFTTLEPALVRAFAATLLLIATTLGLSIADVIEGGQTIVIAVLNLVPLVQGWWTRSAVTSSALVVSKVEDDGQTVAGPASIVETGELVVTTPVEPWAFEKVDNREPNPFETQD